MTQRFDRVEYDIRVSSLPTTFGEKIVMRLASKSALTRDKKVNLDFRKWRCAGLTIWFTSRMALS